jgi:hypothetical protein
MPGYGSDPYGSSPYGGVLEYEFIPIPPEVHVYRVVIADRFGVPLDEVPAKNLQFSYILDSPGSVSFRLPLRHFKTTYDTLQPLHEVFVYRDQLLVWGGYLWTVVASKSDSSVLFGGEGWFSWLLKKRYIDADKVYTNQEQFDIAWDLINFTQSKTDGNLGIVRATVDPSLVLRSRTYNGYERKNLGEALQELAAVDNGFDFEITSDKRWVTYYPNKGIAQGTIFELDKNIQGLSWNLDATPTANEVTAIGSGSGATTLTSVATDTSQRFLQGLMQDSVAFPDVLEQATLDSHAVEELRLSKVIRDSPQISLVTQDPPFGSYSVGDSITLKAQAGYININKQYRITSITVQVSNEGKETVELFFDEVIP